jgi:hypothetical protein
MCIFICFLYKGIFVYLISSEWISEWLLFNTKSAVFSHILARNITFGQIMLMLEMPVPSQGHYVFTVFELLTDFVCLYTYEFLLSLWKIVRSSVILLLPLLYQTNTLRPLQCLFIVGYDVLLPCLWIFWLLLMDVQSLPELSFFSGLASTSQLLQDSCKTTT